MSCSGSPFCHVMVEILFRMSYHRFSSEEVKFVLCFCSEMVDTFGVPLFLFLILSCHELLIGKCLFVSRVTTLILKSCLLLLLSLRKCCRHYLWRLSRHMLGPYAVLAQLLVRHLFFWDFPSNRFFPVFSGFSWFHLPGLDFFPGLYCCVNIFFWSWCVFQVWTWLLDTFLQLM